ncbi:hypothetical protein ACWIUA_01280 [Ursidibacter sp. B-7004-1]
MRTYFQTEIIKAILQHPEAKRQWLEASFKGCRIEITSRYWDPCLKLIFLQRNKNHIEAFYLCEKLVNNEIVWDMPINLDLEIIKRGKKLYNWFQCFGFVENETTLFDSMEELLYQALFNLLLLPIKNGKTLCPIKWYIDGIIVASFQKTPKYCLTDNKIEFDNKILHQIRLLRSLPEAQLEMGELGGFVECEENLSQEGNCWLQKGRYIPKVYDKAKIRDNANVYGQVIVNGNADISENAAIHASKNWKIIVTNNAKISGNAFIRNKFCDCDLWFGENMEIQENMEYKLMREPKLVNIYQEK